MKPNFAQMSRSELKAYVRRNRDDLEALDILVSRRTPDSEATWYAPMVTAEGVPIEENIQLAVEAIQERIALEREQESIRSITEATKAFVHKEMMKSVESREEKKKINQESRNE
ncbi:MAG: hypothetical protein AN487_15255 [Anabaena sp. CRKS33]|jgi:hypothetical protein|nr:MAG: hypothetical protein AN487_15255 [Anabaena sp. CRKS33]